MRMPFHLVSSDAPEVGANSISRRADFASIGIWAIAGPRRAESLFTPLASHAIFACATTGALKRYNKNNFGTNFFTTPLRIEYLFLFAGRGLLKAMLMRASSRHMTPPNTFHLYTIV